MSETALYLDPEQLCVGLYIHLDLSWMDHSFTFSNFKIKDDKQLAEVRALQLKRVRYDPARSDCKPLPPAAANVPQPPRPTPQPSPEELAAQQAKQARVEKLRAMRQNLLELDKKLQKASQTAKNITRNLRNQPQETRVQAQALVDEIVTVMLGDENVVMHALNGKGGDDGYFHALNVTVLSVMLARVLQLGREDSRMGDVLNGPEKAQPGNELREFHYTQGDFQLARTLLYARSGISLSDTKDQMVYSRLARRLRALGLNRFEDYFAYLQNNEEE